MLNQHPGQQQQFLELSVIFEKLEQQQRITDQRFEQVAYMFNNLHSKLAQDHKHSLGQIFNSINQLNKTLSQQQADLLKPPVEVGIKQTLLDYQHTALKAHGWSWQRIAQELNARGTVAVSSGMWNLMRRDEKFR